MNIAGIICEYNPFHNGHKYHISAVRQQLGGDTGIVCVMSGSFVQRGDCAMFPKHSRARAALLGGADLVIELPTPWVLSSAENYARGGVWLLDRLGIVTHISFGSECGDIDALTAAANGLDECGAETRRLMSTGISYAAAREQSLKALDPALSEILSQPNNILGVEYLRAIRRMRCKLLPVTIMRHMAGHNDSSPSGAFASASHIRENLDSGWEYIPAQAAEIFRAELEAGRAPAGLSICERAILSRLRSMEREEFDALPHSGEGLGQKLYKAVQTENSLDAVFASVKSKRYPMARIRRMTLCAWLGIGQNDAAAPPPYIRVLGANDRGLEMLHEAKKRTYLPIITKPAAAKDLAGREQELFQLEARITAQYGLAQPKVGEAGAEWRMSPVILFDN